MRRAMALKTGFAVGILLLLLGPGQVGGQVQPPPGGGGTTFGFAWKAGVGVWTPGNPPPAGDPHFELVPNAPADSLDRYLKGEGSLITYPNRAIKEAVFVMQPYTATNTVAEGEEQRYKVDVEDNTPPPSAPGRDPNKQFTLKTEAVNRVTGVRTKFQKGKKYLVFLRVIFTNPDGSESTETMGQVKELVVKTPTE